MSFKKNGEKEQGEGDKDQAAAGDASTDSTPIERLARSSAEWRKSRLKSSSSLPLSVPEEKTVDEPTSRGSLRDSQSTAGTRSSLDFSSLSVDGTAASTAYSTAPASKTSSNHSASNSITTLGAQHPLTSTDVAEAAQRLSVDVMTSTQCLVSCTPVQDDVSPPSTGVASAQQHSSFSPNYPYSHYAHGFGDAPGFSDAPGSYPAFDSSTTSLPLATLPQSSSTKAKPPRMPRYNFHISGTFAQVMDARSKVLRDSPFRSRVTIKVPRADVIDSAETTSDAPPTNDLKPHVRSKLDDIAQLTSTHIAIVAKEARGADLGYGLETERCVDVVISGQLEGVEYARIKTLVMLEELSGLASLTYDVIDQKFHNILGGRKREVLQKIQEQTNTSIYLPLPLAVNLAATSEPAVLARLNTIHITGDHIGVGRAKDMIHQVSRCAQPISCANHANSSLPSPLTGLPSQDQVDDLARHCYSPSQD